MLLVSGANGNLARSVIANLLQLTDPGNIIVTTRDPASANAREFAARGVTVRHGDFDKPGTLGRAFAGATRALLISTYADNSERLRQNLAALEAAKAAGIRQISCFTLHRLARNDRNGSKADIPRMSGIGGKPTFKVP